MRQEAAVEDMVRPGRASCRDVTKAGVAAGQLECYNFRLATTTSRLTVYNAKCFTSVKLEGKFVDHQLVQYTSHCLILRDTFTCYLSLSLCHDFQESLFHCYAELTFFFVCFACDTNIEIILFSQQEVAEKKWWTKL